MTDYKCRVWMPAGNMPDEQRIALSVPCQSKPQTWDDYMMSLENKINRLILEDPQEARTAIESTSMTTVASMNPISQWAANLMYQDELGSFTNLVDWSKPGEFVELEEPETIGGFFAKFP